MEATTLNIFKNLEGDWRLERQIYDARANQVVYAEGEAQFRSRPDLHLDPAQSRVLDYEEVGILQLSAPHKHLNFRRKYKYKYQNGTIAIYLDDGLTKGDLFQKLIRHDAQDRNKFVGTEHLCRADTYQGNYHFKSLVEFSTRYEIEGPQKKMEIETWFLKKMD